MESILGVRATPHAAAKPAFMRAAADLHGRLITNLISNAIKYNKNSGRVRVQIRTETDVTITVDDTGYGLSEAQLGRLFEPFNRLSANRSEIQGTGLGLVITKQLIEALNGKLIVWSQLNKGSRFQIHLPRGNAGNAVAPSDCRLDPPSKWAVGMASNILYIEDDGVNALLMQELFKTQPEWRLNVVTSAAEGISMARSQFPDLILIDMNLPDANGLHVLHELKADERTKEIRCVAVSADAVPEHVSAALRAGFDDYWTKPLDSRPCEIRFRRKFAAGAAERRVARVERDVINDAGERRRNALLGTEQYQGRPAARADAKRPL